MASMINFVINKETFFFKKDIRHRRFLCIKDISKIIKKTASENTDKMFESSEV